VNIDKIGCALLKYKIHHFWFIVIFILPLISCVKPDNTGTSDSSNINIADMNLEIAIREAIDKPIGEISKEELEQLTKLSGSNMGIKSIEGIEYCINLKEIHLIGNEISNIDSLASLADDNNLIELGLDANNISNISPLRNFKSLEVLGLSDNKITDVTDLSNIDNIRFIGLMKNDISSLTPFLKSEFIDAGDEIFVSMNPLSPSAINFQIPQLIAKGVIVYYNP